MNPLEERQEDIEIDTAIDIMIVEEVEEEAVVDDMKGKLEFDGLNHENEICSVLVTKVNANLVFDGNTVEKTINLFFPFIETGTTARETTRLVMDLHSVRNIA